MTAQGLLVKGTNGEDYLLTTEPDHKTSTHRLVVLKKVNDQWKSVEGTEELVCREGVIGAFVDFFVDLCRVLNSSDYQQVSEGIPIKRASGVRMESRRVCAENGTLVNEETKRSDKESGHESRTE